MVKFENIADFCYNLVNLSQLLSQHLAYLSKSDERSPISHSGKLTAIQDNGGGFENQYETRPSVILF